MTLYSSFHLRLAAAAVALLGVLAVLPLTYAQTMDTGCSSNADLQKQIDTCNGRSMDAESGVDRFQCKTITCVERKSSSSKSEMRDNTGSSCPSEEALSEQQKRCLGNGNGYEWSVDGQCKTVHCTNWLCAEMEAEMGAAVDKGDWAGYDRMKASWSGASCVRVSTGDVTGDSCDDLMVMLRKYKDQPTSDQYQKAWTAFRESQCGDWGNDGQEDDNIKDWTCADLRAGLGKLREGTAEYKRLFTAYQDRCIDDNTVGSDDRCAELYNKLQTYGSLQGTAEYRLAKEEYARACIQGDDNPCVQLRNRWMVDATGPDVTILNRLCPADKPVTPDPEALCVRLRASLEDGGYTEREKELYRKTCFNDNDFAPEGNACQDLRLRMVVLLNAGQSDKSEYADLKSKFHASCDRSEPPAGFEDDVHTDNDCDNLNNPFPDTFMDDVRGCAAANLYWRGVIGGFPDGEFKGDRPVNRAEAAKFLLLACNKRTDGRFTGKMRDVLNGQWYTPFVEAAADQGIIAGYPDGTFKPGNSVNRAEFLKMLSRACGLEQNTRHTFLDVQPSDWFSVFAGAAQKFDLFLDAADGYLKAASLMTRQEVAVAIYQYLSLR